MWGNEWGAEKAWRVVDVITPSEKPAILACIRLGIEQYRRSHACSVETAVRAIVSGELHIEVFTPRGRMRLVTVPMKAGTFAETGSPFAGLALDLAPIGTQGE